MQSFSCVGRLAFDPDVRFFEKACVTRVRLAFDSPERERNSNQFKTVWLDAKAWSYPKDNGEFKGVATVIGDYCVKGDLIAVSGQFDQEEWTDKNTGEKKQKIILVIQQVKLLPKAKPSDKAEEQAEDEDDSWADDPKPEKKTAKKSNERLKKETASRYASTASKGKAMAYADGQAEELEDIPF